MTPSQKNFIGSALAALSVLAFAVEWWFIRELEKFHLTGFLLLSLLFACAVGILSIGIISKKVRKSFPKNGKKWLFAFGVVDIFAFGFFFLAILDIPVVKTLLWSGLAVFYVLFLSPFILGETLTGRKLLAGGLGFGGMAIFLILGNESTNLLAFSKGDLYAFLCGISMMGFHLIGGKIKAQPIYWKVWFTWFPGAIILPVVWYFFGQDFVVSSFKNFQFSWMFLGLLVSSIFIAMICYQFATRYIEASKIATIRLVEPIFQGITAFLIANETLNVWQGIGAMVLLSGIFLVRK